MIGVRLGLVFELWELNHVLYRGERLRIAPDLVLVEDGRSVFEFPL